jgi:nucleotide-binding universal stress UspA family protein
MPESTVGIVLRQASRPVITVPLSLPLEENVLVAYDGSRPAAQALFAFVALGLGENQKVHIANVAHGAESAASIARPACDFLESHEVDSQLHAVSSADDVDKVILNLSAELDAGLLVAGAYGKSRLHEFVLGSTTRKLIRASQIPVFMFH